MFSSRGTIQSEQNHIFVVFFFHVLFGEAFSVYWSFAYTLWFLMGFGFIFCMCVSCVFICFAFKMFFVSSFNCFPIVCLLFSQKKDFEENVGFEILGFEEVGRICEGLGRGNTLYEILFSIKYIEFYSYHPLIQNKFNIHCIIIVNN